MMACNVCGARSVVSPAQMAPNCLANSLRQYPRGVQLSLWQDEQEFFATSPRDHVAGTAEPTDDVGHLTQYMVANLVAETVIDPFEVIDVHHDGGGG